MDSGRVMFYALLRLVITDGVKANERRWQQQQQQHWRIHTTFRVIGLFDTVINFSIFLNLIYINIDALIYSWLIDFNYCIYLFFI